MEDIRNNPSLPDRWAKFVDDKIKHGVVIRVGDDTKGRAIFLKPGDSIPSDYNMVKIPKYRLMTRAERRK